MVVEYGDLAMKFASRLGAVLAIIVVSACGATNSTLTSMRDSGASITQSGQTVCSTSAAATIQAADDPRGSVVPNFPPANAPALGLKPLTQPDAEALARAVNARNTSGPVPSNAPTSSHEVAYSTWAQQAGMPMSKFINPVRCVWVVRVQASYTPPGPAGVTAVTHSSYTVIIDAGSHYVIGITAP